jgi:hypothetical protein
VLYELLTGRLPFEAADALEWVHCHVARTPRPPVELVPDLPQVVSDIVMRLLAKLADAPRAANGRPDRRGVSALPSRRRRRYAVLREVLMKTRSIGVLALAVWPALAAGGSLTCDPQQIDPKSHRLTTRVQGQIVVNQDYSFWDALDLGKHEETLADLNEASTRAAEKAADIDPRNQMAHGILARQYLVLDQADAAATEWRTVLDGGGAVVWTATLYDVDARSYFFVAFDKKGIRIYRFGAVVGPAFKTGFGGIAEFPSPENERFWAMGGGCIDPALTPEAEVPWANVREIKAGNWVLWFKLTRPITASSDRGKRKTIDEIKVNLHGRTGTLEAYKPVGEDAPAMRGVGPAGYNDLVRRTLVKFVDPERRIALPPLKPGAGW